MDTRTTTSDATVCVPQRHTAAIVGTLACLILATAPLATAARSPESSLDRCQSSVDKNGRRMVVRRARNLTSCMQRVSRQVVARNDDDLSRVARSCARKLLRVGGEALTGRPNFADRFVEDARDDCDPTADDRVTHTEADVLGSEAAGVAEPLEAAALGRYCASFGGSGTVADLDDWLDCLREQALCEANLALAVRFPRAVQWLAAIRDEVAARDADALAVLDALDDTLDADDDGEVDLKCGPLGPQFFPRSGQTISYPADKNGAPGSAVPDDGAVQSGAAFRYRDNGDGTVTDFNTGLMWEKKDGTAGLHGVDRFFPWSAVAEDSVWDWLDDVNAEGGSGFAGHSDWRLSNVKELVSIVDYDRTAPSVAPVFDSDCVADCTVTECSCTGAVSYWSSTSLRETPAHVWRVNFEFGFVDEIDRTEGYFVRAVRDLAE